MPFLRKFPGNSLGRGAILLAIPVVALVIFGVFSLRWEKSAHEEELRSRCLALTEPLRREFLGRISEANELRENTLAGDIESLPRPGEIGDSLAKFAQGEYQVVLGQAGSLSETGLPLRPLAAIRLMRTEEDPVRLEELTQVIAAEPSFLTKPLLREAEERHHQLGAPLPPVLTDWEAQMERSIRVQAILNGRNPSELLTGSERTRWLTSNDTAMIAIRTSDGPALIEKSRSHDIINASEDSMKTALPEGVSAKIHLEPTPPETTLLAASDSELPLGRRQRKWSMLSERIW